MAEKATIYTNLGLWKLHDQTTHNRPITWEPIGLLGMGSVSDLGDSCLEGAEGLKGGGGRIAREFILPKVKTFEQARNKALELLGKIDPATRKRVIGRLPASGAKGKVIGFTTEVDGVWKRFRLDYDPIKGAHINVEIGKGANVQRYAVPWEGTEQDFLTEIERLQ